MKAPAGPRSETGFPQQRHQEAADDGGEKPAVRRHAGGDRDGHRQRQRHDGDGQSRDGIGAEIQEPIALAQDGDEFRSEKLRKGGFGGPDGHGGAFFFAAGFIMDSVAYEEA